MIDLEPVLSLQHFASLVTILIVALVACSATPLH